MKRSILLLQLKSANRNTCKYHWIYNKFEIDFFIICIDKNTYLSLEAKMSWIENNMKSQDFYRCWFVFNHSLSKQWETPKYPVL